MLIGVAYVTEDIADMQLASQSRSRSLGGLPPDCDNRGATVHNCYSGNEFKDKSANNNSCENSNCICIISFILPHQR